MPRTGLTADEIVVTAADLADAIGFDSLTLGALAQHLQIKPPSLYKHLAGQLDLQRRIATLAFTELDDALRSAVLGSTGRTALAALMIAFRSYVTAHPGRYGATIGLQINRSGDPLADAGARVIGVIVAVLRGYGIPDSQLDHAVRTVRSLLHGYAVLIGSNAFQWDTDLDASFEWMLDFADGGLATQGGAR